MLKKLKKKLKKRIKKVVVKLYQLMLPVLPVQKDLVVFDSSIGLNYTGSPRAVYERMVELGLDQQYKCVWFFQKGKMPAEGIPGAAKVVRYGRLQYLYYMAVAGIWVFDARQPKFIRKKEDQHYIQTWHGTPLKKLALDMDNVAMARSHNIERYKENFVNNTKTWDYLIAQNDFSDKIFRRCFAFDKEMLCIGYPRNDVLFRKNNPEDIRQLKIQLGLPLDKKIILYAPTWRDNEYDANGVYEFRPALDFDMLRQELEGEYVMAVKYHYLIGDRIDWSGFKGFVYPFTAQAEISSLYLVADAMITDYSSVMFDYSLLHRPMYFYTYDLESYRDELRGFYFDFIEEAPGPISLTTEELVRDIKRYGTEPAAEYAEKCQAYYEKFHTYENGTASDQIIAMMDAWTGRK